MEQGSSSPVQLELVDSHAHVDMSEFDSDRADMLARAQAAGVRHILAIGGAPGALASAGALSGRYDWIYAPARIPPPGTRLAMPAPLEEPPELAEDPKI